MSTIFLIFHVAVIVFLLGVLLSLALNLLFLENLQAGDPSRAMGTAFVSVLVPARNEAGRIGACIKSLLVQDYPHYELLVLDDNSEDETAAILERFGLCENDEVKNRRLTGKQLPGGWTGKCWACHQLAQNARGDFLLFTDADTIHAPGAIRAAVAHAQKTNADLLSAWPRLITKTWSEKLMIPMIHLMAVAFYPHAFITFLQSNPHRAQKFPRRLLRALGGANGQFLLFKKSAYDAIGGHAAVRAHLVEDVALGREITQRMGEGMRLINCDASRFVDCRMYSSLHEVWEGFSKNARPAFENALALWWFVGVTQFCAFFLPFVLVFFPSQQPAAFVEIVFIYVLRIVLTARLRTSWLGCVLHPFGHALAMAIAANSWRLTLQRGVTWKGRVYQS